MLIGTDSLGRCESNYHTKTFKRSPQKYVSIRDIHLSY